MLQPLLRSTLLILCGAAVVAVPGACGLPRWALWAAAVCLGLMGLGVWTGRTRGRDAPALLPPFTSHEPGSGDAPHHP